MLVPRISIARAWLIIAVCALLLMTGVVAPSYAAERRPQISAANQSFNDAVAKGVDNVGGIIAGALVLVVGLITLAVIGSRAHENKLRDDQAASPTPSVMPVASPSAMQAPTALASSAPLPSASP